MKKIICVLLCGVITFALVGCGSAVVKDEPTKETNVENTNNDKEKSKEQTKEGIKFTLGDIKKEEVKGDRTADNVSADNGEYFAIGKDIVKASDYEYIVVDLTIENTTDKAITFSRTGWTATMKDGYKLKDIDLSKNLTEQSPSHNSFDGQIKILVEKKLNISELELKYNVIDYANMGDMMKDALNGKSKEECKKQYPELFKENFITFNIKL